MKKAIVITAVCGLAAAMTFTAFADSFTPSISQKLSPETSHPYIVSESGDRTASSPSEISVHSIAKAEGKAAKYLEDGYNAIKNEKSLLDAIDGLEEFLDENAAKQADKIVVRDLFYVSFQGETAKMLEAKTGKAAVHFALDLAKDTFIGAARFVENQWEMIPDEDVSFDNDGCLEIILEQECAIAVLTQKK